MELPLVLSVNHLWANFGKLHFLDRFGANFPATRTKTKSVVHLVKYKDIHLKICMWAHFMVVQAVLEKGSSKLILSTSGHPIACLDDTSCKASSQPVLIQNYFLIMCMLRF